MSINEKASLTRYRYLIGSLLLMVAILIAAVPYTYVSTKKSYRKVGFNDGVVAANVELIKVLRMNGSGKSDCSLHRGEALTELARAKSDAVYLKKTPEGVLFCEYK